MRAIDSANRIRHARTTILGLALLTSTCLAADYEWWVGVPRRSGVVTATFLLRCPHGGVHHFHAATPNPHAHPHHPDAIVVGIDAHEKARRIVAVLNAMIQARFPDPHHVPIIFTPMSDGGTPPRYGVRGTAQNGWTALPAIGLGLDCTQEHTRVHHPHHPPHPHHGRFSLTGEATGESAPGVSGLLVMDLGGARATVPTTPGLTAYAIETAIREQLRAQGIDIDWEVGVLELRAGTFQDPGDGQVLRYVAAGPLDVAVDVQDSGIDVEFLCAHDPDLIATVVYRGDCDQNGVLGITDALVAAQMAVGLVSPPGPTAESFAACNTDGEDHPSPGAIIDTLDALRIAQAVVGLMTL